MANVQDTMILLMLDYTSGNSMMCKKANDLWGQGVFTVCEALHEASVCEALPKNFYAQLLTDIIGYTISPADMRKRWKPVDEDRTQNQNEHYPTLRMHSIPACCRQLPWLVHLDKNQK